MVNGQGREIGRSAGEVMTERSVQDYTDTRREQGKEPWMTMEEDVRKMAGDA